MTSSLRALSFAALLVACGGGQPAQPAQAPISPSGPAAKPEPPPLLIEYVVVRRRWVEKLVPVAMADVKSWSEAPENADAVGSSFRHILIKVAKDAPAGAEVVAKKRAQALLDRLKKGEDFATLAKQSSEDPGSKERGGEYPASMAEEAFVEPVKRAFAPLKVGEIAQDLVRSDYGFHIIKRDRPTDDAVERAYRRAKAPELMKRLAEDLQVRFKDGGASRNAIAESVTAVLGDRGANDADRPKAQLIERTTIDHIRLPAAAKAAITRFAAGAHPGDTLPSAAIDGDTAVVARAAAAPER